MLKQELLMILKESKIKKGDKVKLNLNKKTREYGRLNNKEVEFDFFSNKYSHFNRYGEQKQNASTGWSSRNCSIDVIYNNGLYSGIIAEGIESIEMLTNTSRRKKDYYADVEEYDDKEEYEYLKAEREGMQVY